MAGSSKNEEHWNVCRHVEHWNVPKMALDVCVGLIAYDGYEFDYLMVMNVIKCCEDERLGELDVGIELRSKAYFIRGGRR
ncbi:hypothetical protein V6N13_137856 [Hibiscus sabdariffa]|uniref:Uncharacterized protein n=1 Tax=Hibiscus sabdariffa TaxID=183260 RepID=A0ABR2DJC6_9ROSI